MEILKYSEPLDKYTALLHEATEGRYKLTGYDLHVVEAALQQLQSTEINQQTPIIMKKWKFVLIVSLIIIGMIACVIGAVLIFI